MNLLKYIICLLAINLSSNCWAFSAPPITDKKVVITRHFSPYSAMAFSSLISSGLGVLLVPKTVEEKRQLGFAELKSGLQYTVAFGAGFWMVSVLSTQMVYFNRYSGTEEIKDSDYIIENINPETLNSHKRNFYFVHGLGVIWNSSVALQIENKDKWLYVGAVAAAPFLTDIINRLIFNPSKVSPYRTISLNIGFTPDRSMLANFEYRF